MSPDILVVDDERDIRELVAGILEDEGYAVRTARDSDEVLKALSERRPSLIFLDIWLQGSKLDGLEILDLVQDSYAGLPVVMISGHGTIETAVSAIRRGAYDYIEKPFNADKLIVVATRALETLRLRRENTELKERAGVDVPEFVGGSQAMNQLRQVVDRIARTNSRVMITGESGSGKEVVARSIHKLSERADRPFIILSAATITPDHMEEKLFGVDRPNGQPPVIGALEEAHGGTLYLDEIAEMPRETQNKILRVLVDQTFTRVGGEKTVTVDVRVISSTGRDVDTMIGEGSFREDLYHRLSVVPLRVPSLKDRRDDIPELVSHFMDVIAQQTGLPIRQIGDDAMALLQSHDWPGNIRQLRNNVERLMILTGGDPDAEVTADMLPQEVGDSLPPLANGSGAERIMALPLREAREIFERDYLVAQISRFGGNISKTAEFIGMERSALHRKLKLLGLNQA